MQIGPKSGRFCSQWISWVSRDGSGKPEGAVVLVAATKEEAEARAIRWAEKSA
jgi:hypothetical protein